MIRFLINLSSGWPYAFSNHSTLLIDLALEWGDFAMWEEVLNKTTTEGHAPRLGLDELIRALNVFTFDRTKNMLVHSTLAPIPHLSLLMPFCRIEKVIRAQTDTKTAIDWITALQAHTSGQDPSMKTWLKQQTTAVLSSIKSPPTDHDIQMFVNIAKSEGLPFFSQTCVPADGRNDSLA